MPRSTATRVVALLPTSPLSAQHIGRARRPPPRAVDQARGARYAPCAPSAAPRLTTAAAACGARQRASKTRPLARLVSLRNAGGLVSRRTAGARVPRRALRGPQGPPAQATDRRAKVGATSARKTQKRRPAGPGRAGPTVSGPAPPYPAPSSSRHPVRAHQSVVET